MLTVDANVFVSAASTTEVQYGASMLFLSRLLSLSLPLYYPTIVVSETTAGIVRPTNNVSLARRTADNLGLLTGMNLIAVDENRARLASELAITYRLRGADAIYVAVAQEFGTILITWDTELLTRGRLAVPVITPTDWLVANPTI